MRGVSAGEGCVWWLWVHEEGRFVHEWGILCAELVVAWRFVHEWGILCAELRGVLGKR